MADTLETLEIKVVHSGSTADVTIHSIADAVERLSGALQACLPQLKEFSTALKRVGKIKMPEIQAPKLNQPTAFSEQLRKMVEEPDPGSPVGNGQLGEIFDLSGLDAIKNAVGKIIGLFTGVKNSASSAGKEMKDATDGASRSSSELAQNLSQIGESFKGSIIPGIKAFGSMITSVFSAALKVVLKLLTALLSIGKAALKAGLSFAKWVSGYNAIKKVAKAISGLGRSIARIAFYRVIRSLIKTITEAFTEGLEHAYKFSASLVDEGKRFSTALDSMATSTQTFKNQLGSAFISLLTAIAPVVNMIVALITRLMDALSQFIAAFTGSTYLKAVDFPAKWGDDAKKAAKAAKEWKNQILGFDEINRLEEPSNRGSGEEDVSGMFKSAPISESIKNFVDMLMTAIKGGHWTAAGKMLAQKINELIPTKEQFEEWGKKLGEGITGGIKFALALLNGLKPKELGAKIGAFISKAFSELDASKAGELFMRTTTFIWDIVVGMIENTDWLTVGQKFGEFMTSAINSLADWIDEQDWEGIGASLLAFFQGIDYEKLAEAFFRLLGTALGSVGNLLEGFFKPFWDAIKEHFDKETEAVGGNLIKGIWNGVLSATEIKAEWMKEHVWDPFIGAIKECLGIHSPSTIMEDVGNDLIQGLINGITAKWEELTTSVEELWNRLKLWWEGLKLKEFHIPHPVFEWTYTQATGALASALEFVGLSTSIPHLNISWAAKGGIVDGATLIGAGEAGKEAIIPLEQNTQWISSVAQEMNRLGGFGSNDMVGDITRGVYDGVTQAMSEQGASRREPAKFYINGKEFARAIYDDQKAVARERGINLATG